MRLHLCIGPVAIASFCATQAIAQPNPPAGGVECGAQQAALERDMDVARSKGQMLRRRELEQTFRALQSRCGDGSAQDDHRARVVRQENEVLQRRLELDRAEEELRRLRAERP